MGEYLLEVNHLSKYYKARGKGLAHANQLLRAVDDVSFKLRRGEVLGVVGESGCGKSTMGNTIIRLLEPDNGEIIFEGHDLAKMNRHELRKYRADIQMIFQDPFSSLDPRMHVFDIIAEPLRVHRTVSGKELEDRVLNLMEVVGLDASYAQRYPHEFSGGQRQRIGIARALALQPKLVICDEPVSALDVSIQAQILNLLEELKEKMQLTYIFIAHGLPSVKYISDRIAVMYLGRIVELADTKELFAHQLHPYTQGLLQAIPIPDPNLRKSDAERAIMGGDIPNAMKPPEGCYFHPRCPYATADCCNESVGGPPILTEVRPGHFVSCFHAKEFAEK